MKKLIITADDFGLTEKVNNNIIASYKRGAVTAISLLAEGGAFGHAVKCAKENGINKIGAHLSFPEGYKTFFLKYFTGCIKKEEIYVKFKKQISEIKKAGFTITHLDGHQHIHMAPGVLKIVIKLMKEEGINCVRFPLENLSLSAKLKDPCGWIRNIILSFMCGLSWKPLVASGLKHNDFFIGHARALGLRRKDLFGAIAEVKDGLTELGCHPGERTEERDTLCDKAFLDELKNHSIELVSWDRL